MRRPYLFVVLFPFLCVFSAAAPIEFFATVTDKTPDTGLPATLSVAVTPTFALDVAVTSVTEIRTADGEPASIGDIGIGDTLAVEAVYTASGFLALEIRLTRTGVSFEVKGLLDEVGFDYVTVQGITALVNETTVIRDELKNRVTLADLKERFDSGERMLVKVEGEIQGDDLVASEIKISPRAGFARISLEGIILSFPTPEQFLLDVGGGTEVLVNILPETTIAGGELAAGLFARVQGFIGPDLSVNAWRIRVVGIFEVSPDALRLDIGETKSVTVVLRQALDVDLVLQLTSRNELVAAVSPPELTVAAGELSGQFDVTGVESGRTSVEVAAGEDFGALARQVAVAVGEIAAEQEPELEWTPRVIRAVPNGAANVRLMLKHAVAPDGLVIPLTLVDATPDLLLEFPETVTIPVGERDVRIPLGFLSRTGAGKLRATLPDSMGGDSADLDIDLRPAAQVRVRIEWQQNRVEVRQGEEFRIRLRLADPAPPGLRIAINPVSGDPTVLARYQGEVEVAEGSLETEVRFQAAEKPGRVRLRAAVTRAMGGDHSDLDIRVR